MKKIIEFIKIYGQGFLLFQIPFILLSLFLGWEIIVFMNVFVIFGGVIFWIVLPFFSTLLDKLTPAEAIGRIIGKYWYVFLVLIILIFYFNK